VSRTPEEREAARRERARKRAEREGRPIPPEADGNGGTGTSVPPAPERVPEPEAAAAQPEPEPEPHPQATQAFDPVAAEWDEEEDDDWVDAPASAPVRRGEREPEPAPAPAPRKPRRERRVAVRLLAFVALVFVGVVLYGLVTVFQPFSSGKGHGEVSVRIPQGSGASQIGGLLADKGVVGSGFLFNLRAALAGKRESLRSGTFVFAKDMSYGAALDVLTTPPRAAPVINVTIPEGQSIGQTAAVLQKSGLEGSYIDAARRRPPAWLKAPRSVRTLEGALFPATYQLKRSQDADVLVQKQLAALKANLGSVSLRRARAKNLTPYDVLVIASMIEREAQVPAERPLIAAVIYNRLRKRIPLGIDATTRYALNNFTEPLKNSDFPRSGKYDTRHRLGLPPTPIGNPGLASIRAAANPARAAYLYYVVRPGTCGRHAFSTSYGKFQADSQKYSQAREAAGGKSPTKCG
jgi:uncharacterized YceG family protein